MNTIAYTYIWPDKGGTLRSKTRFNEQSGMDMEQWSFDGSSTGQAETDDSDLLLQPVRSYDITSLAMFGDTKHYISLCEVMDNNDQPVQDNTRRILWAEQHNTLRQHQVWVGFEQEYILWDEDGVLLGSERTNLTDISRELGQQYCDVNQHSAIGSYIANKHAIICRNAGINITGVNAEVLMGQYEFQVFEKDALLAADNLLIARWILQYLANQEDLIVDFTPKPITKQNGSGLHVNFSTHDMRNTEGSTRDKRVDSILTAMSTNHKHHSSMFGFGNEKRLTGTNETSRYDKFTYGVGDRTASVRIPPQAKYLEDRRPGSNADPYKLLAVIDQNIAYADQKTYR